MARRILWKSPKIPESAFESDEALEAIMRKVMELNGTDTPSSSDLRSIFYWYNEASARERDAIDAAFVWMTGYTLVTIVAMVVTHHGDYEQVLALWRGKS